MSKDSLKKIVYNIKETNYLVLDKNIAYLVNYNLAKLPNFLDYASYALIVISAVLIILKRYLLSAYLFIAASVLILFSYYFYKIFIIRKIKMLSQNEKPYKILFVEAKQGVRRFEVDFFLKNGSQKHIKLILSYKSFLELYKFLKNNNIPLKTKK